MSWQRGKASAQDLCGRVLAAPGRLREVAERFGVHQACVPRVRSRHRRLNQACAGGQHNHVPLCLAALNEPLLAPSRSGARADAGPVVPVGASRARHTRWTDNHGQDLGPVELRRKKRQFMLPSKRKAA